MYGESQKKNHSYQTDKTPPKTVRLHFIDKKTTPLPSFLTQFTKTKERDTEITQPQGGSRDPGCVEVEAFLHTKPRNVATWLV